ncbi:MAG TPA: CHAD domain-containing protein [Pyrinomonadaceae bacterium]|jgi:CHAD domain-containing protein|nr:CHAD domain-containing protein [Pyrinomonadaceae bacterium]
MAKARRIRGIDCNALATIGIQQALIQRFDEMCTFRAEALDWKDPVGVHSMRVASRRLRSALRSFLPYLNEPALAPVAKQIKTLAGILGEVRDQDVAIEALQDLSKEAPKRFSNAIERLLDLKKEVRETARGNLKKEIGKTRLKNLRGEFQRALTSVSEHQATITSPEIQPSYSEVARIIIDDRLSDLEELSKSLYYPNDVQPLHDMRIAAKRLRYAIDLFSECWQSDIGSFAKQAALLQTDLGQLHDCDVWIDDFKKRINSFRRVENRDEAEAFVWLFTYYQEQRNKHYREAFFRWSSWQREELSTKLRDMLHADAGREINASGSESASSSLSK